MHCLLLPRRPKCVVWHTCLVVLKLWLLGSLR